MARFEIKSRPELTRLAVGASFKSVGETGVIEGYGSIFGVKDSYGDIVSPGAFKASLAGGDLPRMLWQHDDDDVIGVWDEAREDATGLYLKGRLCLDTKQGAEAYALLKMGALKGLSIGFVTKNSHWDEGTGIRFLDEIDLWEVSLVTFPALKVAQITTVKSGDIDEIDTLAEAEKMLREGRKFSKKGATAFIGRIKHLALTEREARSAEDAVSQFLRTLQS